MSDSSLMPWRKNSSTKSQVQPVTRVLSASPLGMPAGVAIIIIAAFIAYLPSLNGGFVWDDDLYITNNHIIQASSGLYKFWFTTEPVDYYPISNTILWIEWRLWGMNPTGYHITSLILHIVETMLIWVILRKLSIPGAFLAALIFAVHPVNVESVAWIAQLKDMMAMLFFLLSILWYLKSEEKTTGTSAWAKRGNTTLHSITFWYLISLAAFALAMLSKGSVAILPVLLLGIIWWLRPMTRWDLLRTAPFFTIAAVLTIVNVWFQTHGSGEVIRNASFTERLLGAGGAIWFYIYKALLPVGLAPIYTQWQIQAGNLLWWLPLLAALFVTAMLWRYRANWSRSYLFAWVFFCLALVPVMGFSDALFMRYSLVADRYQHIALINLIVLVSAGLGIWHQRAQGVLRWAPTYMAVIAVGVLTFLTWQHSRLYRDSITLYRATLEKNPASWIAHYTLGFALVEMGQAQEGIEQFEETLRLNPDCPEAHNNLGAVLAKIGQSQEAIEHLQQALRIRPDYVEALDYLASTLAQIGRPQEAIEHYRHIIRLIPDHAEAYYNLGNELLKTDRVQEAIDQYQQALRLDPDYVEAHSNMGSALLQAGRPREASEHYQRALRLKPDFTIVYPNLALAYAEMNQSSEAIITIQKGLELARSQGQTVLAKQMEEWLNSYRGSHSDLPGTTPAIRSAPHPQPP